MGQRLLVVKVTKAKNLVGFSPLNIVPLCQRLKDEPTKRWNLSNHLPALLEVVTFEDTRTGTTLTAQVEKKKVFCLCGWFEDFRYRVGAGWSRLYNVGGTPYPRPKLILGGTMS
jgi:hypothetical protein